MSCSCGDSGCNCLEYCVCPSEFCACIICFNLRYDPAIKQVKENPSFESIPSTSRSCEIFDLNTDCYSDGEEIVNTISLYEEMQSDVFCIESSNINGEAEKYNSSNILFPEINLSDGECEMVYEKQGNCSIIESSAEEEDNFSRIIFDIANLQTSTRRKKGFSYFSNKDPKSDNANLETSSRKRKRSRYSSNKDPNYKGRISWNKHRSGQRFPKKTHVTRFLERQYGWRIKDECEIICEKQGNCSAIECPAKEKDKFSGTKSGNASSRRRKSFCLSNNKSHSKVKKSGTHHRSGRKSYYELPRKTHISQWRQWTSPMSGNSQVSAGILQSDHAPQQHIRQPSRALTGHYPRLMVTVALDALSDNRVIQVNKDNRDVTESETKKEDNSLEIKSDNANNLQSNTRSKKGFHYRPNNDSNSKLENHRSGQNNYAMPRKKHITQLRKQPHNSTGKYDNVAVSDNRDTQVNEDINEYSNSNRYFNQRSPSNIEHDVNRNQTTEHSSVSNPSYSNLRRNSSDLQSSRYVLFTQKSRFPFKNRNASWNNPNLAPNDNEALPEKINEEPSSSVWQQTDFTPSIAFEMPKKKYGATKPSTICENRQKKMPDSTIYDFDENETRNSPDQSYHGYLNPRKCCGNHNLNECEANFFSTVKQRGYSGANRIQNTDKSKSVYEATRKNPSVLFLNPSYPSLSDICNDYEQNYSSSKRKRNRRRKRKRKSAGVNGTIPINELVSDMISAGRPYHGRRKCRTKIPSKEKEDGIERKIRKRTFYIQRRIKKEKELVKKKTFIKEENP